MKDLGREFSVRDLLYAEDINAWEKNPGNRDALPGLIPDRIKRPVAVFVGVNAI